MSRLVIAALAVLALVVGIGIGLGAGLLAGSPAPTPVAVIGSPSSAAPTGAAGSPGPTQPTETASGGPATSPSSEPVPTPEPTPTPVPTPVLVPAPLTGMPVKPAVATRHVIAVMIDDQADARPQSGLSQAAVVWEAPAEGGIPRYMALFQDTDPTSVGPIRSSRLYYIAWAAEWHSVYVHAGGSPQAIALLSSSKGRGSVVYDGGWNRNMYRVSYRFAPHNLYSDGKSLRKIVKAEGAKPVPGQAPVWNFAPDAPIELRPKGGTIVVPYLQNRITYSYDRVTNTYPRSVSIEGKEFDAGVKPKVRIAPKNVVVMQVLFVPIGDKKHRLDGQVTGSGTAWIATNGKTIKGTWRKKTFTSPTHFYGPDGKEVTLTMGQTFIQVVTRGTSITVKDGKVPVPAASPSPAP